MSENNYDLHLEELLYRSTGRLLMAEVFDLAAFQALEDYLWQKAEGLRNEHTLSKQVLACIRSTASAIESLVDYVPAVRENQHMAITFHSILDRLIAGETRDSCKAGAPRIK